MPWGTQDNNSDAKVQVSGDYSRDGEERTDFLIIDKTSGEHTHLSISPEPGSELIEWHNYQ